MRYRNLLFLLVLLLALSACNLTNEPEDDFQPIVTATGASFSGRPSVTILSPEEGDEVVVNTQLLVRAQATDPGGVQRVQLLANGQIVKTVSSESPTGDASLEVVLDYTPRSTGDLSLAVIAYRGAVPSDPAEIEVVVRAAQAQVTATSQQPSGPVINPNDPTCRVLTNVGLNLRTGPGTAYPRILTLAGGTVAPIIGRIADNSWWQLRVNATTTGWVSSEFTTEYGICTNVPLVTPPPTPTSPVVPTNTPLPTSIPPTPAPNPTATTVLGPADLLVTNISGPIELLIGGGQTQVTGSFAATITNMGSRPTGQFSNVVIRSPGGVEIPLGVVASLNAGESIILTTDISFDAAGRYTLQVRADSGAAVAEASEVNNVGIFEVNITAAS